jgi:hypothetical protein
MAGTNAGGFRDAAASSHFSSEKLARNQGRSIQPEPFHTRGKVKVSQKLEPVISSTADPGPAGFDWEELKPTNDTN